MTTPTPPPIDLSGDCFYPDPVTGVITFCKRLPPTGFADVLPILAVTLLLIGVMLYTLARHRRTAPVGSDGHDRHHPAGSTVGPA